MLNQHECKIKPAESNGYIVCPCCGEVLCNIVLAQTNIPEKTYLKMPQSLQIYRYKKLNLKSSSEIEYENTFRLVSAIVENLGLHFLRSQINEIVKNVMKIRKTANSPYIIRICSWLFHLTREMNYPIEIKEFSDYCSPKQIISYLSKSKIKIKPVNMHNLVQKWMIAVLEQEGVPYNHSEILPCLSIAQATKTKNPKLAVGVALNQNFKGKGVRQYRIAEIMNLDAKSIRKYLTA